MPIAEGGRWSPNERIVSAGVFTRENDLSFLPQGISNIGGAIVAPFPKGPAYTPTLVDNQTDLETWFGVPDGVYYGPYSAREYLTNQGQITVVRVGPLGGYIQEDPLVVYAVPATTERFTITGSLTNTRLIDCTVSPSGSILSGSAEWDSAGLEGFIIDTTASAGFIVSASVRGELDGETYVFGDVSFAIDSGEFSYITGSDGTYFGSASVATQLVENFLLPNDGPVYLTGQPSGSFTLNREPIPTDSTRGIFSIADANLSGSFGELDYANRVEDTTTQSVLAVLANTAYDSAQNLYGFSGSALITGSSVSDRFELELNTQWSNDGDIESSSYGTYVFSIDETSPNFLTEVFGTDPKAGITPVASGQKIEAAYVYKIFKQQLATVWGEMRASGSWAIKVGDKDAIVYDEDVEDYVASYAMKFDDGVPGGGGGTNNAAWSQYDIRNSSTPWINSQLIAPWIGSEAGDLPESQSFNLFRVHSLSDGTYTNTSYKLEISNVRLPDTVVGSDYAQFDVGIRSYNDTDAKPSYLELFTNCNLDPNSVNYVARKIGDRYDRINFSGKIVEYGEFGNKSRFVRIEMAKAPYPVSSIPAGFDALATPIGGEAFRDAVPAMTYTNASVYSLQPGRYASGVQFTPAPTGADEELEGYYSHGTSEGSERDNKQYFAPLPVGTTTTVNEKFDLNKTAGVPVTYDAANESTNIRKRRFVVGFQGGFDGQSPSIPVNVGDDILPSNQQGLDCSARTASGSVGYKLSINALGNADEFDINLLWTPGIIYNYHTDTVRNAVDMCEARGDCFYVFDVFENQLAGGRSVENVVEKAREFDTNYAATYYPWVRIVDQNTNRLVTVPPSVVMPAVYAQSDRAAAEWFAPAGLSRGGIETAVQVMDRLTHSERDVLYEGRVNPIVSFPGQGISAWGQKTLQVQPSALDRINVRRLLINLKKFIASSSKFLVFEQNVAVTRNRFLSIVNPYLESVQQRSGLYAFRVVMDESNNTPDIIDRSILYGQIYLQPTKTAEFILLDFNVLPTGAQFDF